MRARSAMEDHLEVLKWARENGAGLWDEKACTRRARTSMEDQQVPEITSHHRSTQTPWRSAPRRGRRGQRQAQ